MKAWYAVRSKPKKEFFAAEQLARAAIDVYVPQVLERRGLAKAPVATPFFPGYFFGQLDPERGEIHMVRYTSGVLDVVGYGGQPWPVPDELVQAIKERLSRSGARSLVSFNQGDRVLITNGPLRDYEAVFERHLSAVGRAMVFVRLLQRLCQAEINVGQLRLIGKAAGSPWR